MSEPRRFWIAESESGERLDRWLARAVEVPRNRVQKWIAEGRTAVNRRLAKPATVLAGGDEVELSLPEEAPDPGLAPEEGPLEVVWEDADVAVLDKAAGVAVHPGAGRQHGTLAHFLLHRYPEIASVGGPGRPGIVHRLDIDTTGLLAVARSERAYLGLAAAFAKRSVSKTYLAVVYGAPREDGGEIDLPIGRDPRHRKRMRTRAGGRPATTRFRRLESVRGISRLELDLLTGRTHQIRVHLKAVGHPLVGDPVYGEARWRNLPRAVQQPLKTFPRPALHAWRLTFAHPVTGAAIELEAPVPPDLRRLWREVTDRDWPGPR